MSESLSASALVQILDHLPGVTFCSRMDAATGQSTWIYLNPRAPELWDVSPEALRADPNVAMERLLPEDRARCEASIAESIQAGLPMSYAGRMKCRDGSLRWVETQANVLPEPGGTVLWYGQSSDVTERKELERALAESESSKSELIERLRYSIDELSNPILEVWDDVLAMPIIGVVDSRRTADMVQRLLNEVARTQASFVIIDLTGVELVDTKTADHLMKLMRKVEIVGARCVLTGIRPAVAETLVDIGVDFGRLGTLRNLRHGLKEALRFARRQRRGDRDLDIGDLDEEDAPAKRPAR
jgi:rsbT co-antagonist protein RsbR